jgi:hypothetical protein
LNLKAEKESIFRRTVYAPLKAYSSITHEKMEYIIANKKKAKLYKAVLLFS